MHNSLLFVAFYFGMSLFIDSPFNLLLLFLALFYYIKHYQNKKGLILILFLFCFLCMPHSSSKFPSKVVRIDEVRANYAIASDSKGKYLLYNVKKIDLMDLVQIEGTFEKINNAKNRDTFQFENLCRNRGIKYSMYVKSYETMKSSNHPRALLYRYIDHLKNNSLKSTLKTLFYHIQEKDDNLIFTSGMHLSFLASFLSGLFHKRKDYMDVIIAFIYLLCFPIAVFSVRILIFAITSILMKSFNKKDQLGVAMILSLLYNPSYLHEVSFQLPVLFRLIYLFDNNRLFNKLKTFIILFPYQLYFFHECYPIKILLFSWYRKLGGICFLFALITLLFPFLSPILLFLFSIYKKMDEIFMNTISIIGKPYIFWIVLWIIATLALLVSTTKKTILLYVFLIVIQLNLAILHPFGEVTYLDVGQGDSILIREPFNGGVTLIDVAGKLGRNIPEERIYPYLKMEGIKTIDNVILTHDDYDHSGGLKDLKKLIKVKKVIRKKQDKICMKKICLQNVVDKKFDDKNDDSIVLYAEIAHLKYMFMGDASKTVEKEIIEKYDLLKCDILKVGHHGSNTSSSRDFLIQLQPEIAIISSGYHNYYGHPHKEVLSLLNKSNTLILNTQNNGSISIFFSSFINFLRTGNDDFAIIR